MSMSVKALSKAKLPLSTLKAFLDVSKKFINRDTKAIFRVAVLENGYLRMANGDFNLRVKVADDSPEIPLDVETTKKLLKAYKTNTITLSPDPDDNKIYINVDSSHISMRKENKFYDADEKLFNATSIAALDKNTFLKGLDSVLPYASREKYAANLHTTGFFVLSGKLHIVATDGFKLGMYKFNNAEVASYAVKLLNSARDPYNDLDTNIFVLPLEAVEILKAALNKLPTSENVVIGFSGLANGNYLHFKSGDVEMSFLVPLHEFPDITKVFPKNDSRIIVKVRAKDLFKITNRLAEITETDHMRVRFGDSLKENALKLFLDEPNFSITEYVEATYEKKENPFNVTLNPAFVSAAETAWKKFGSDELTFKFYDPNYPVQIEDSNFGFTALVMPIREI